MNNYTIITAFFDIGREKWNHYTRSVDKYLYNAKRMLSLHDDMIVFIEPKFVEFVSECRKDSKYKTNIIPININQLYWYKYLNKIQNIMDSQEFKSNLINSNCPEVSNALYDIIMFSKTQLINLAIQNNLSVNNHYVWLDFGIHDNMLKEHMLNKKLLNKGVNDKIKFLCREYPKTTDLNLHTFFKSNTNRFAGTMFSGSKEYLLKFNELLHTDIIEALNNNVIDCDQNFFSNVYVKNPNMFNLYFGDWSELITNYYELIDNRFYIEYMLKTTTDDLGKSLITKFLQTNNLKIPQIQPVKENSEAEITQNGFLKTSKRLEGNPEGFLKSSDPVINNFQLQNTQKYSIENEICLLTDICKINSNNLNFHTIFFNNLHLNNKYIIENIKLNINILNNIINIAITENNVDKYIHSLLVSLGFIHNSTKNNFVLFSKNPINNETTTENTITTQSQQLPLQQPQTTQQQQQQPTTIKLMCNWLSNDDIIKLWDKFNYTNSNIKFVNNNNVDYYVIINKPQPTDYFEPNKTIVFRMEPDTESTFNNYNSSWDNWFVNKNSFKWFGDLSKHMNNNEWHLSLNYETILNTQFNNTKTKLLSGIVSNLMTNNGHIFRINLLQQLQNILLTNNYNILDIYGRGSSNLFKNHCGELPYHNKDNGLLPYKYHIAIENTNLNNYFTEKLIDGILSECCVFYWGCNNINTYFDDNSFIQLPYYSNDLNKSIIESIQLIINSINNDEYSKRLPHILKAKHKILTEYSFVNRLKKIIN
jgi:protein YibB